MLLVSRVGGRVDAALSRGVPQELSFLRHHHLLSAVVCDAIVLYAAQLPLRKIREQNKIKTKNK